MWHGAGHRKSVDELPVANASDREGVAERLEATASVVIKILQHNDARNRIVDAAVDSC